MQRAVDGVADQGAVLSLPFASAARSNPAPGEVGDLTNFIASAEAHDGTAGGDDFGCSDGTSATCLDKLLVFTDADSNPGNCWSRK